MVKKDNFRSQGLRKKLVRIVRAKGISDERVLSAIGRLPRHLFLDDAFMDWAYKDVAFPIDADQTISQPYTVAFQSALLDIQPKDKVLEIGTGSGYQACILVLLGAKVYTIERQESLYKKTSKFLEKIGYTSIRTLYGDGYLGAPRFAPFNKIIVTAGATEIPKTLLSQLKIGGYLVIPAGSGSVKKMYRVTRVSEDEYKKEVFGDFQFVPFLKGVNGKE